jgi:hypothetical protein
MTNVIEGKLEAFFETGTEGIIWSVYEDGKEGYDGLHSLEDGDYLMVFHPDDDSLVWEGNISLEYVRNYRPYQSNPECGQQEVLGRWVHGLQDNVDPEIWATWFLENYPSKLVKSTVGHLFPVKSSTIVGYGWSAAGSLRDAGDLTVKFKSGYYKYKDVDATTFWSFYDAESKGRYFAQHIKDKFDFEKVPLAIKPVSDTCALTNEPSPCGHQSTENTKENS